MNRTLFLSQRKQDASVQYLTENSEDNDGQSRKAAYETPTHSQLKEALYQIIKKDSILQNVKTVRIFMLTHEGVHMDHQEIMVPLLSVLEQFVLIPSTNNSVEQLEPDFVLLSEALWAVNAHQQFTDIYSTPEFASLLKSLYIQRSNLAALQFITRITLNCCFDLKKPNLIQQFIAVSAPFTVLTPNYTCELFMNHSIQQHETRFYLRTVFDFLRFYSANLEPICPDPLQNQLVELLSKLILERLSTSAPQNTHFEADCFKFLNEHYVQAKFYFNQNERNWAILKFLNSNNKAITEQASPFINQIVKSIQCPVHVLQQIADYSHHCFYVLAANYKRTEEHDRIIAVSFKWMKFEKTLYQQLKFIRKNPFLFNNFECTYEFFNQLNNALGKLSGKLISCFQNEEEINKRKIVAEMCGTLMDAFCSNVANISTFKSMCPKIVETLELIDNEDTQGVLSIIADEQ
ncbi:Hypothetical_protein [Hexamita inflata]|uniref:Hypothetical_protein n=1 Tax=Hexamita inflata TaxID=28002 RepID=A0AA86U0T7_9EUKA|nr:Hypothetical protein HINF_LOCUS14763 [Hexamita inflata]